MEKENILHYLKLYEPNNHEVLEHFLNTHTEYYARSNTFGQITSSAFIISHDLKDALLIHHKKYNKWLSPGGHVDSGETSLQACLREVAEEVNLTHLVALKKSIFDIDIHQVPDSTKNGVFEPAHWHFDVRYIFKAQKNNTIEVDKKEVNRFQWTSLSSLTMEQDESIQRQAKKAQKIINDLKHKPKAKL